MKLAIVVFAALSSLASVKGMWLFDSTPQAENATIESAKKDDQAKVFGSCDDGSCAKAAEEEKEEDDQSSCCREDGEANPSTEEAAKFMGIWESGEDNKQGFEPEDEE